MFKTTFKGLVLVSLAILAITYFVEGKPEAPRASSPSVYVAPNPADAARNALRLKDFNLTKGEFGTLTGSFTFENPTDYDLKDAAVRCDHTGPSGTTIDRNDRTIYEVFKARSTRTIRGFNMGFVHSQAARASCSITSAQVADYTHRLQPAEKTPIPPTRAGSAQR